MRVELSNFQHPLLCRRGHLAMQSKLKDKVSLTINFCLYYIICMLSFYKAFIHNSKGKMPRKMFIIPDHYKKIL